MQWRNDKIEGRFHFEEDYQFDGLITGDAEVARGVHLMLNGVVSGTLFLMPGSSVQLNGTVGKGVAVADASLRVAGVVRGKIVASTSSQVTIVPEAKTEGMSRISGSEASANVTLG